MKLIFIVISILGIYLTSSAEVVDRIIAVVNNEIVLKSDLETFTKKINKKDMIDDLLLFGEPIDLLKKDQNKRLDYLINEKILESEIKKLNLSVTMDRVDQEIRDIAKRNGATKNELINAIKSQGMSLSEYQSFIKNRIERQSLIEQEVSSKIRISEEDVMAEFIRNNPTSDAGSYEYTLAHILFNPKKGGAEAALARAQNVLNKLKSGESFETLAEQNSEDTNFNNGGLLGTFKTGDLNETMEQAVRDLDPNQISKVVQTKAGFHIIKVIQKKMGTNPAFERQKERLRSTIFDRVFQKQFKNWLEQKKEDAFVRIN